MVTQITTKLVYNRTELKQTEIITDNCYNRQWACFATLPLPSPTLYIYIYILILKYSKFLYHVNYFLKFYFLHLTYNINLLIFLFFLKKKKKSKLFTTLYYINQFLLLFKK
jgi:hypothetical protein